MTKVNIKYLQDPALKSTCGRGNEAACHLRTWYMDAFYGTGSRASRGEVPETESPKTFTSKQDRTVSRGSATIALGSTKPFDHYLFIDKSKAHVATLERTIKQNHPALLPRCELRHGDAICIDGLAIKKERAVVFFDPICKQGDLPGEIYMTFLLFIPAHFFHAPYLVIRQPMNLIRQGLRRHQGNVDSVFADIEERFGRLKIVSTLPIAPTNYREDFSATWLRPTRQGRNAL